MSINNNSLNKLGIILFAIGLILGMLYQGGTVWADFESSMFDSVLPANWADTNLKSYDCPLIIGRQETGIITTTFTNHTEKDVNLRIRMHISEGMVTYFRELNTTLPIAPGETEQVEWSVFPEDAAWGYFILVRIFQFQAYQIPSRSASCGVIVLDLFNLTGNQIVIILIVASFLGMLSGITIFIYANRPLRGRSLSITAALLSLIVINIAGVLVSFMGSWIGGMGVLLLTVLLLLALLPFALRVNQI